jgi:hypothetical protein
MAPVGMLQKDFRLLRDPGGEDPLLGNGEKGLLFFEPGLGLEVTK